MVALLASVCVVSVSVMCLKGFTSVIISFVIATYTPYVKAGRHIDTHKIVPKKAAGFSVIEAVAAIAISSFITLAMAAGQISNLRKAGNSLDYTLSLLQANNAIERVWSNLCALEKNPTLFNSFKPGTQSPKFIISYPNQFHSDDFHVVVKWTDKTLMNNFPNQVNMRINFPLTKDTCRL